MRVRDGVRVARCGIVLPLAAFLGCSSSSSGTPLSSGGAGPSGGASGSVVAAGMSAGGRGGTDAGTGGASTGGASTGGASTGGAGAVSGVGGTNAAAGTSASAGANGNAGTNGSAGAGGTGSKYDAAVLADQAVAFWGVNMAPASEPDLTGNGHSGMYQGGVATRVALPNGDSAEDFDGATGFLSVPSSAAFSIPTTGTLTWEGWIRPDVLEFPHHSNGYVDWLGKCAQYAPTCEWEARMYKTTNAETRPNRLSAYVFNPGANLGSAADWQPSAGLIVAGNWYHVVGQYSLLTQPTDCTGPEPGSINIWVNGVEWNHASHGQTGCMSQYHIVPKANGSALNIGTMAKDSFFKGAIGKVAIYAHPLTQAQITSHYLIMTGKQPSGSCADMCGF